MAKPKPTLEQRHAILLRVCRQFCKGNDDYADDDSVMYPFDHKGFDRAVLAIQKAVDAEDRDFVPRPRRRFMKESVPPDCHAGAMQRDH